MTQEAGKTGRYADGSDTVIGACIEVHRELGPGLLESAYEQCLCHELRLRGVAFQRQAPVPVFYKDLLLDCGYRVDLLVEERLVLEIKSVERTSALHEAQTLTYLKLMGKPTALLVNFNVRVLKAGLRRISNDWFPSPQLRGALLGPT
jgi:GxxExxY protein